MVTMSEFGRTAQENGDSGTDNGDGSLMMVRAVRCGAGRFTGSGPGWGAGGCMRAAIWQVLGELVSGHLGQKNLDRVFSGFKPSAPLGLLKA